MHELVAAVAPGLAPLIRAHLADLDGTPMHAAATASYFYRGEHEDYERRHYGEEYLQRHGTGHERAARILGVDPSEMPAGLEPCALAAFIEDQRERWRWDAHDADALIAALPPVTALRGYDMRGQSIPVEPLPAGILATGVRVAV